MKKWTSSMPDVWDGLKANSGLRVNATGKFDFFWCVLEQGNVALALKLPDAFDPPASLPKFKSLDVSVRQLGGQAFVLRLRDGAQRALFRTLCEDVVAAAECGVDLADAVDRAIRRTRRWSFLLRSGSAKGMSVEEQRGFVGELAFLQEVVAALGPAAALEAWKGPEGTPKDFEFPGMQVEVKARRGAANPHVRISSAAQLSDVAGAVLHLRVYDVDSAVTPEGETLHDIVARVGLNFAEDLGDFDKWQSLLDLSGYDEDDDYTSRRWVLGQVRTFRIADGFPRIVLPLPQGVDNLSYTVALDACAPFACDAVDYSTITGGA